MRDALAPRSFFKLLARGSLQKILFALSVQMNKCLTIRLLSAYKLFTLKLLRFEGYVKRVALEARLGGIERGSPRAKVKWYLWNWTRLFVGQLRKRIVVPALILPTLPPLLPRDCFDSPHIFAYASPVLMGRRKACHKNGNDIHLSLNVHAFSCAELAWSSEI